MAKDWKQMGGTNDVFGLVKPPRTKEQLIAAQQQTAIAPPVVNQYSRWATCNLRDGDAEDALDMLARAAGHLWAADRFRAFDLRHVDEQGRLTEAGEMLLRPCRSTDVDPGGTGAEIVRGQAVEVRVEPGPIPWKAGEHLDDVLARVTQAAIAIAASAFRDHYAKGLRRDERLWVLDAIGVPGERRAEAAKSTGATADAIRAHLAPKKRAYRVEVDGKVVGHFGSIGPVVAPEVGLSLDEAVVCAWLTSRNLTTAPLLRWEDVKSWLVANGYDVRDPDEKRPFATVERGDDFCSIVPDGGEAMLVCLASTFRLTVRDLRRAIENHVRPKRTYDLSAMTMQDIADAHNNGTMLLGPAGHVATVTGGRLTFTAPAHQPSSMVTPAELNDVDSTTYTPITIDSMGRKTYLIP